MTRVFVDTNVLLDVLLHREPFVIDSARVLDKGFKGEIEIITSPLSFATCMFVASKALGKDNAMVALRILERHIGIATMDATQLHEAICADAPDFEDMLQYYSALAAGCSHIVTRNERHFFNNGIVVLSPSEFLKL